MGRIIQSRKQSKTDCHSGLTKCTSIQQKLFLKMIHVTFHVFLPKKEPFAKVGDVARLKIVKEHKTWDEANEACTAMGDNIGLARLYNTQVSTFILHPAIICCALMIHNVPLCGIQQEPFHPLAPVADQGGVASAPPPPIGSNSFIFACTAFSAELFQQLVRDNQKLRDADFR